MRIAVVEKPLVDGRQVLLGRRFAEPLEELTVAAGENTDDRIIQALGQGERIPLDREHDAERLPICGRKTLEESLESPFAKMFFDEGETALDDTPLICCMTTPARSGRAARCRRRDSSVRERGDARIPQHSLGGARVEIARIGIERLCPEEHRFGVLADCVRCSRASAERHRGRLVRAGRFLQRRDRFTGATEVRERSHHRQARLSVPRLETERLTVGHEGILMTLASRKRTSEIVVCARVARPQRGEAPKLALGILVAAELHVRHSESADSVGEIATQAERVLVAGDRLGRLPTPEQRVADVAIRLRGGDLRSGRRGGEYEGQCRRKCELHHPERDDWLAAALRLTFARVVYSHERRGYVFNDQMGRRGSVARGCRTRRRIVV